jgi:hypothetical protein
MRILKHALFVLPVVGAVALSGISTADAASGIPKKATKVAVSTGNTTPNIDATLPASGAIVGKVRVKGSGKAAPNVSVEVLNSKRQFTGSGGFTDSSGKYSVFGLNTGKYFVCVFSSSAKTPATPFGLVPLCFGSNVVASGFRVTKGANAVAVSRGHKRTVNFQLPKAGAVSGSVKSSNKPIPNGVSVLVTKHGTFFGSTFTQSANYEVDGIPAGSGYQVCFNAVEAQGGPSKTGYLSQCWKKQAWSGSGKPSKHAKAVKVKSGKNTKHVNASLKHGGAISGKIVSTKGHKAVIDAFVEVFHGKTFVSSTQSSSHGAYTVRGLPTGKLTVCAEGGNLKSGNTTFGRRCYKKAKWSGLTPPKRAKKVSVKAGKTHRKVNIALPPVAAQKFGSISGKLTTPGSVGLGGATAEAFHGKNPTGAEATTNTDGTYTITNVPAGSGYSVCFQTANAFPQSGTKPDTGYRSVCAKSVNWDGGALPAGTKKVSVKAGKTTKGVNATAAAGGAISGTVKLAGSGGTFGPEIFVYNSKGDFVNSGSTDGSGNYTVTSLTPSSAGYFVCFDAGFDNFDPPNHLGYVGQCWKNQNWSGPSGLVG